MTVFAFDNTYARDLPGAAVAWPPATVPAPRLLFLNTALADELGVAVDGLQGEAGAALFAGNTVPEGAQPVAQAYAGHQFGGFSPQLGDGRALLLGEVVDRAGARRDIAFKGSGRTPFSRSGDGKAAVGPMLREALIGEAMHARGIPTTRALAVAATGETVMRDAPLPGAVLTRVAASHLRVGTFQYFAHRGDLPGLRALADYAIARHDPALTGTPGRHLALLHAVAQRQAGLIAQWMHAGFIHGVMNTDNMTISGETIDYGPCAFMEAYDPAAVFSSIDHQGRYAFGNQPRIARWNLSRFAETLLPLMADAAGDVDSVELQQEAVSEAMGVIDAFPDLFTTAWLRGARAKLGLRAPALAGTNGAHTNGAHAPEDAPDDPHADADMGLAEAWLMLLQQQRADFTLAWRRLADAAEGNDAPLRALLADPEAAAPWLAGWRERCARDDAAGGPGPAARAAAMRRVNPWIIPRNHQVEAALAAAQDHDDLAPFQRLMAAVRAPFDEVAAHAAFAEPAPSAVTAGYQTFCGT